ncbi:transcriptional regulator with XRE-family HTH domain [Leucobacter exalbidus]|uniref:Transcriptional regulator with XRE-family HTH domain n=1 Tax=Leucobacter exalbidus TaxID=662960 RepID=A0A940T360_9MICO|nr:helix-turn-helix domain-containing protein [Leucobacter exalbidus]MBP1325817.1 transcriptional regulator with XRE-family HTH domain [Leucobacter exalbidus]
MPRYTARLRTPADFGLAVQQARMERELTQNQLAADSGIRQSSISEIESGKSTIYLKQLLELARATGLELSASWGDEDDATLS